MGYIRKTFIEQVGDKEFVKEILIKKEKERNFVKFFGLGGLVKNMSKKALQVYLMLIEAMDYNNVIQVIAVFNRYNIRYGERKAYYKGLRELEELGVIEKIEKGLYKVKKGAKKGVNVD